jgi:hypothetical protein
LQYERAASSQGIALALTDFGANAVPHRQPYSTAIAKFYLYTETPTLAPLTCPIPFVDPGSFRMSSAECSIVRPNTDVLGKGVRHRVTANQYIRIPTNPKDITLIIRRSASISITPCCCSRLSLGHHIPGNSWTRCTQMRAFLVSASSSRPSCRPPRTACHYSMRYLSYICYFSLAPELRLWVSTQQSCVPSPLTQTPGTCR